MDDVDYSTETWKTIPGFPDYLVSDMGRIKSFRVYPNGKILGIKPDRKGYPRTALYSQDGKPVNIRVHTAVLAAFVGTRPDGMECGHLNGNPADNRLANLAWITSTENKAHQKAHGTMIAGSLHRWAAMSPDQVIEIRRRRAAGLTWMAIAQSMGLKYGATRSAGLRLTYQDIC